MGLLDRLLPTPTIENKKTRIVRCVVSRDGPLLNTRAPAFTPVIDREPAMRDRVEAMACRVEEQDDCDMLLISAM